MSSPLEATIVRVFTRNVGGTIPDNTIALNANDDFEVVVDFEAGSDLIQFGVEYTLRISAVDFTDVNNPAGAGNPNFTQSFTAHFTLATNTHVFTVHVDDPAAVQFDELQYRAVLRTGSKPPFFVTRTSDSFIIL